jgi:16S rRNA (cytosine967-C5)-methyltransferase
VRPGERVADLCAAPGGKTAQLAAAGAQVTALDRSAERLKRLATNLQRLNLSAEIRVGDALAFDAAPFDAILLDAPCSATGTIRRHPDVAWTKKPGDIGALAAVQSKMLDRAAALLASGGRLVYCTCSLEPEEGELQIAALLRRNPDLVRVPILYDEIGGLAECLNPEGELRTLPCHLPNEASRLAGLDGFFAARLARR